MHAVRWIWSLVFPSRAATQTWMMLTFALVVGVGVVGVLVYSVFLYMEGQQEEREALALDAERIAYHLERSGAVGDLAAVVDDLAQLTQLDVTVVTPSGAAYRSGTGALAPGALDGREELMNGRRLREGTEDVDGETMYYAAVHRASGWVVRVGQDEDVLYSEIRRLESVLVVSLMLVFMLTLLGSWIAADKITAPLRAISRSARSIGEGDFSERIVVVTRAAELQDLAQSLNRMSERYREKIGELERLARLQNEFIGNVSHEVRNPIFALSGYLEALAGPKLSESLRQRYAQKGLVNLERLNNLFNDLIEIARLEYREDLLKDEPFDFGELVDDVAEMLLPKADAKGLTLEWPRDSVYVDADRNRMRQVMINLIDNAIAYSDEGTIRCRYRRKLDKVRVEVVDSGRGIPEEHLERIFERFHRVDPDRSRKSGGTGLGLSIVKQIIHAHGEHISVESTVGRGTRFWFELPHAEVPEEMEVA
jgi:signal transduction histidine kinase